MIKQSWAAAIAVGMLGWGCAGPGGAGHTLTLSEQLQGFRPLFDGKSLDGWTALDEKSVEVITGKDTSFSVQDGMLHCSGVGKDYWIREKGVYADFILRLEYKVAKGTNSGIFLRVPERRHPAFSGFEIQILDDFGKPPGLHTAGAIYDVVAPRENASVPAGEWNAVEVRCEGPRCTVVLNGKKVIDVNFDDETFSKPIGKFDFPYKDLPRAGYIGVQNHGGELWFRNLRIREL